MRISYFITPHGFGHAARSCAIMEALRGLVPDCRFDVVTTVPEWFIADSLSDINYVPVRCDIGLVQKSAMQEDPAATIIELDRMLPFGKPLLKDLAKQLCGTDLIVTDCAAMGIAVAKELGVPSVLVENFTWSWIYEAYLDEHPDFRRHIAYLQTWYDQATDHIQMEPLCAPVTCDLTSMPVSRPIRSSAADVRKALQIDRSSSFVLVSMGGIQGEFPFLEHLRKMPDVTFMIPGASEQFERTGNLVLTPQNSGFHHPDLVNAADAIICKAGYSTLAEAYHAGIPMGYMLREQFRESGPFGQWIPANIPSMQIATADWLSGAWVDCVPKILAQPRQTRNVPNGAAGIAQFLVARIKDPTTQ